MFIPCIPLIPSMGNTKMNAIGMQENERKNTFLMEESILLLFKALKRQGYCIRFLL